MLPAALGGGRRDDVADEDDKSDSVGQEPKPQVKLAFITYCTGNISYMLYVPGYNFAVGKMVIYCTRNSMTILSCYIAV